MKKGFLSLKWQAVLSVSSILIFGIGFITYFGKKNLEQTYVSQRDRVFQGRHQAVTGALHSMQVQMLQLAGHMEGLAELRGSSTEAKSALRNTLERNWDQLNFEWGIDSIALYNTKGGLISRWGTALAERGGSTESVASAQRPLSPEGYILREWISNVSQSEIPVSEVWCDHSCWQVVIVPVFLDDSSIGTLLLARSLAGAVLQFQSTTAADVGILIPYNDENFRATDGTRLLERWQHEVVALTGAPATYNVLEYLSSSMTMSELAIQRPVLLWDKKHYEISQIPLMQSSSRVGASLVVLEDVSADLQRLQSTLASFFLAAVATLLLAEMVLLWLLWQPMVRLQVIAKALPKLAHGPREKVNFTLNQPDSRWRLRNEIHELFDAATLLSHRLEQLDTTVKLRTKGLQNRSRELLEERNFVTTLLNNVRVVILTQDRQGYIRLLNSEGRRLTGMGTRELQGLRFADCVEKESRAEVELRIAELFSGNLTQFHHESDFVRENGERVHMDWYHSHLPNFDSDAGLILSVGLDLTARKTAEQNLAWLADHDPLTQLYNRRHFQNQFSRALKKFSRSQQPGALIFFDVDQFKMVNDTFGHPAGDRLLCEMAAKLCREVRDADTLARLGGDEFAILLEHTDSAGAVAFARKLCESINDTAIIGKDTAHRVTISIGIALYPEHGETVDELMANADFAMYKAKAKSSAKSSWHVYSPDAPEKLELKNRVDWKARIEDALDNRRLLLHYQPILDIGGKQISHYEALVRMRDENGAIIPPGRFIPVAEKTGLIHDIDCHVVNLAIADLSRFCKRGRHITVSVNLSARAIADSRFISSIERLVEQYGVERRRLIFELTETSAVEDIKMAAELIGRCRKLGYQFALDDFGVGFASWFYLRQLPVNYVKIDGSFVRNLANSIEDRLFVKAINDVAQGLGVKTIAEFVEDAPSLALLSEFGVDYAQGYYVGKPQQELLPSEPSRSAHLFSSRTAQAVASHPSSL